MSVAQKDGPYALYERMLVWGKHLDDPNHEPTPFFEPFTAKQMASLELVRSLTAELAAKRAADEEAAAAESVQPEAEEVKEDEVPAKEAMKPSQELPSRCVPGKKVNADESLFTKYA